MIAGSGGEGGGEGELIHRNQTREPPVYLPSTVLKFLVTSKGEWTFPVASARFGKELTRRGEPGEPWGLIAKGPSSTPLSSRICFQSLSVRVPARKRRHIQTGPSEESSMKSPSTNAWPGFRKSHQLQCGTLSGRSRELLPSRSEQMRFSGVGFLIVAGGLVEGELSKPIRRELRKYIRNSHFFPSAPLLAKSEGKRDFSCNSYGQPPRAQSRM